MPDGTGWPPTEVLESRAAPSGWRERWSALPRAVRRAGVVLAVLVLLGACFVWFRDWSAERELARRVVLTASLGVASSSTTPPGGEVGYFVVLRNDGARRMSVTEVEGATGRVRLRMRDDADRRLDPGTETAIPLSVRLTCVPEGGDGDLTADIGLRREDGGSTTRRVVLQPAALLLDVASTLCAVRPDLRDHEVSGPVLRTRTEGRAGN